MTRAFAFWATAFVLLCLVAFAGLVIWLSQVGFFITTPLIRSGTLALSLF